MRRWTWRFKVEPDLWPNMAGEQIKIKLQEAAVNSQVKNEVRLWELIRATSSTGKTQTIPPDPPVLTLLDLPDLLEHERRKHQQWMLEQNLIAQAEIDFDDHLQSIFANMPEEQKKALHINNFNHPPHPTTEEDHIARLLRAQRAAANDDKVCGGIAIQPSSEGRIIRMVGRNRPGKGWNLPTLIIDATGDAELLKPIYPQLEELEPRGWEQLPQPPGVRIFQCVDKAIAKIAVAVEGKNPNIDGARRLYAAVLNKTLEYGGAAVGVITYKSTRKWIEKTCFVPDWLKLMHWGDITGTNALQHVRALFVVGRPLASAEAVTQQTEALFGEHIPQREYVKQEKGGCIPITADAAGNNCILVDVWEHPHPMAERLRRQITEGAIIQAVGRARAGLREADEPLDLHLWTDVPVPELGPVEPVLWDELEAGLDGLMLATAGVWLGNIADAERAFPELFSANTLKIARDRARAGGRSPPAQRPYAPIFRVTYQRDDSGCKPAEAVFLRSFPDPRGWLEQKLGRLVRCENMKIDIATAVQAFMAMQTATTWTGTATELLGLLGPVAADATRLSGKLHQAAAILREAGIGITFSKRKGHLRTRNITITAPPAVAPRADANGSGADVRLNDETIRELADAYLDLAGAELQKTGDVDCTALDRRFCGKLVAVGLIPPNSIEAEFKRVMAVLGC
jgi:hypothetical protein